MGMAVQVKQGGVEHGDGDSGKGGRAARNQRTDIQPGMGADRYGGAQRSADARAEHCRNAQSSRGQSDGFDGKIPKLRWQCLALVAGIAAFFRKGTKKAQSPQSCPWRIDIVSSFERNVTMLHWWQPLNGIFGRPTLLGSRR